MQLTYYFVKVIFVLHSEYKHIFTYCTACSACLPLHAHPRGTAQVLAGGPPVRRLRLQAHLRLQARAPRKDLNEIPKIQNF